MNNNSLVKIQATWRSHITQTKIKNLYVNLPRELQIMVLEFMRKDIKLANLYKSYSKIYYNKICRLNIYLSNLYYHFQIICTLDFEDYIDAKIIIKDKIEYYKYRLFTLNEIT